MIDRKKTEGKSNIQTDGKEKKTNTTTVRQKRDRNRYVEYKQAKRLTDRQMNRQTG